MKRLLLPASALVLVVTACGAGAKPAPRVTDAGARPPGVHATVARRRRAATLEAEKLLHEFVPPPGARSIREPPKGYGGMLRQTGWGFLGETADRYRYWRVRKPLAAIIAFFGAHAPRGGAGGGSTIGTGNDPPFISRTFVWPRRRPRRSLTATVVGLRTGAILGVAAQAVWIYPRSPRETVPSSVREIVVRAPTVSTTVKDPAQVDRIVRWFDALPVGPPGIVVNCPLELAAHATLSFRSGGGTPLAEASVPLTRAGICDPIGFTVAGRREQPLVDGDRGESFVRRLQRLLGVRLVRTRR